MPPPPPSTTIPQFYFPKTDKRTDGNQDALMNTIKEAFHQKEHLTELEFLPVTTACGLPQYMNLALFRAIDMLNDKNDQLTCAQFSRSWPLLTQAASIDDIHSLMYTILKKPELDYLTPDDFLPVLEDIVLNHPALQFLENNITFQERYIETVICRIYYDAHCPSGRLTFNNFKKSGIATIIQRMTPSVDLYTTHNLFSYKQFYVLYCKLWSLDRDHDLAITETDLCNYNMGALTRLAVERIMEVGHIAAFTDTMVIADDDTAAAAVIVDSMDVPVADPQSTLTYFDFIWFLLSEVDKSTPMAIRYWFRCLDIDDDGILSSYELSQFWQDQNIKQQVYGSMQPEDRIQFDDVMRQMNDLIRPQVPGQFTIQDLKKNVFLAERFFDTFVNFDRFQAHESRQEGSIREQQAYQNKLLEDAGVYGAHEPVVLTDDFGFPILSNWNDYADVEYHRIIVDESYANSYEAEDLDTDNDVLAASASAADEGLILTEHTPSSTADASTTQSYPHTLFKQDQDQDDTLSLTSASSSEADEEEEEEAPSLSEKTPLNAFADAETDSNDDDDFEDTTTPNSPCIFTPKPLNGSDNDTKSSPPITNALTTHTTTTTTPTTTSYFDYKTDNHHQQHTVSFVP